VRHRSFTAQFVKTSLIARVFSEFLLIIVCPALAILMDEAAVEYLGASELIEIPGLGQTLE